MVNAVPLNISKNSETALCMALCGELHFQLQSWDMRHRTSVRAQRGLAAPWVPWELPWGLVGQGPHQPGPVPSPCSGLTMSDG